MIPNPLLQLLRSPLLVVALLVTAVVAWLDMPLVLATVWLLTQLGLAACLGYWLDRTLFHYARPRDLFSLASRLELNGPNAISRYARRNAARATLRYALIIAAMVIALGYALILVPTPGV